MSGAVIEVKIDDREVRDLLTRIAAKTGNLTPAMKINGEIITRSVKENFRQGGRREKWKALADATLMQTMGGRKAIKKRGGVRAGAIRRLADRKILIKSKVLMDSIHPEASSKEVKIGTNVAYAALQQFGGKAGRGKKVTVPARPFLMVQDEDWPAIKEALEDYLLRT